MGGLAELPFGLATSVGHVPGATAAEAVDFVLATQPDFPTVPVLGVTEASLLAQAVAGIDAVEIVPPGLLELVEGTGFELPDLSVQGDRFEAMRLFLQRLPGHVASRAATFHGVRVPMLGPVTTALRMRAAGMDLDDAVSLGTELTRQRSAMVLSVVREVLGTDVIAIVLSEPGLIGAMHPTFPLDPCQVAAMLGPVVDRLDSTQDAGELLIGVHVAGRTDWEPIISSRVSLISAPADGALAGSVAQISEFLELGGRIAWGAVPVDQPLGTGDELLWRRLSELWCGLVGEGVDPMLLRRQSLISPVGGMGHFGVTQATRVLDLVDSLSNNVRRQALGARLSLGA